MSQTMRGLVAMIAVSAIWGVIPLYYHLLAHVPPLEILSHRTLWSFLFFGAVLAAQHRLGAVPWLLRGRSAWVVAIGALMISTNWFVFILAIQIGKVVESSLGYYIFPLVAVSLGVVFLGERLSRGQVWAVGLAALAVVVLTLGLGVAPWIALILAFSFGLYGLVKKQLSAGPVVSVTAEVALLAPLALVWLAGLHSGLWQDGSGRAGAVFGRDWVTTALLMLSGPLTAGPLILFSYASRRITLSSVGLIQYINPTLQFLCAVLVLGEGITPWHGVAFTLIWAALALYTLESWRQDRASRNAARSAGTSPTTLT